MRAMFSQYLLVPCLVSTFKFAVLKKKQFTLTKGMRDMVSQYFRSALKQKNMCNVFTDVIAHMFALNLSQVEQEIATKYFEPTMYT